MCAIGMCANGTLPLQDGMDSVWTQFNWTRRATHSLNSGKSLDTGRCSGWCPFELYPNETLPQDVMQKIKNKLYFVVCIM